MVGGRTQKRTVGVVRSTSAPEYQPRREGLRARDALAAPPRFRQDEPALVAVKRKRVSAKSSAKGAAVAADGATTADAPSADAAPQPTATKRRRRARSAPHDGFVTKYSIKWPQRRVPTEPAVEDRRMSCKDCNEAVLLTRTIAAALEADSQLTDVSRAALDSEHKNVVAFMGLKLRCTVQQVRIEQLQQRVQEDPEFGLFVADYKVR
jgi:hypothetical protein